MSIHLYFVCIESLFVQHLYAVTSSKKEEFKECQSHIFCVSLVIKCTKFESSDFFHILKVAKQSLLQFLDARHTINNI